MGLMVAKPGAQRPRGEGERGREGADGAANDSVALLEGKGEGSRGERRSCLARGARHQERGNGRVGCKVRVIFVGRSDL